MACFKMGHSPLDDRLQRRVRRRGCGRVGQRNCTPARRVARCGTGVTMFFLMTHGNLLSKKAAVGILRPSAQGDGRNAICHGDKSSSAKKTAKRKQVLQRYQSCKRVCCNKRVDSVTTGPSPSSEEPNANLAAAPGKRAQAARWPESCGSGRQVSIADGVWALPRKTICGMPNVRPLLNEGAASWERSAFDSSEACALLHHSPPTRSATSSNRPKKANPRFIMVSAARPDLRRISGKNLTAS